MMMIPKSCFGFCISSRIELIIWACISVILHTMLLCFFIILLLIASGFSGGHQLMYADEAIFLLVLVIELVYNMIIIVASLGKNVKLLRMSFYLGIVLWLTLITVGAVFFGNVFTDIAGIPQSTLDEVKGNLAVFIIQILIRGYMLLIMRNVMLKLQDENWMHGYIDLDKTTEVRTNYGQTNQRIV